MDELQFMKEWCTEILNFISTKSSSQEIYSELIEKINETFGKRNKRGLRMIYNDIDEWTKGLKETDLIELNLILQNKFGKSLIDTKKGVKKTISKIIKRGKIKTDEEFYLVKSFIDEALIKGDKDEAEKLDSLLFAYEKSKR